MALVCASLLPVKAAAAGQDFKSVFAPLLATHSFAEVAISPDGKRVVWVESKVKSDTEYAHTVFVKLIDSQSPAREVGPGDPRAILGTPSVTWSPDSQRFAYIQQPSSGGTDLRIASGDGRQSKLLSHWQTVVNTPQWSPDGKTIAVLVSERDTGPVGKAAVVSIGKAFSHQRLVVVDVALGTKRAVTEPDLFVYQYDWSPDNRQIAFTGAPCCTPEKGTGENNWWTAQLFRLDIESGKTASVFQPRWQIASPRWSSDGSQIAFIGGLMSDFIAPGGDLFALSAHGGAPRNITPDLKASVTWFAWTGAEQILATEIVDGEAAVVQVNPAKQTGLKTLWRDPVGPYSGGLMFAMSVARDGKTSAAARQSFDQAPEVWAGPVGEWKQISSANRDIKASVGKVQSVHWASDGAQVQGWLLFPKDFVAGRKYPMVVSVHGGPAASALLHWPAAFDNMAVLSAFGYFVFYPNPRGSFGQGEAFTQGNVKDLGGGDLRDIQTGVRHVLESFPVDSKRVGLTGWSYGGYMAMWAITQSDMFRASVAGPGVSDWESYYGQTEIAKWLIPYFGAPVYADPELYAKNSPSRFIKRVKAPTLFYVGKEDPICPVPQTLQLWNALKYAGVETELVMYANEGHGVGLPIDQEDVMERTLRWFDKYLQ